MAATQFDYETQALMEQLLLSEGLNESNWTDIGFEGFGEFHALAQVPSALYSLLITFGAVGNATVLVMMLRILLCSKVFTNVYVYVLCLCATDLIYIITGCLQMHYIMEGYWVFGYGMCKVLFIFEAMNKSMSIYLLAMLTADRYFAVCHSTSSSKYRTINSSIITVLIFGAILSLLNLPFYVYAETKPLCGPENENKSMCMIDFPQVNEIFPWLFPNVSLSREGVDADSSCFDNAQLEEMPKDNAWMNLGTYYTIFMIVAYHALPGLLIVFCSVSMLVKIRAQFHILRRSASSRRNRVTLSIIAVVCFYFVCWTPYWIHQLFLQVLYHDDMVESSTGLYVTMVISTFPYISASINPIFYAFLNKTLRQAYTNTVKVRKKKSCDHMFKFSSTTNGTNSPSLKHGTVTTQSSRNTTRTLSSSTLTYAMRFKNRSIPQLMAAKALRHQNRKSILSNDTVKTSNSVGRLTLASTGSFPCGRLVGIEPFYIATTDFNNTDLIRNIVPTIEEVSGGTSGATSTNQASSHHTNGGIPTSPVPYGDEAFDSRRGSELPNNNPDQQLDDSSVLNFEVSKNVEENESTNKMVLITTDSIDSACEDHSPRGKDKSYSRKAWIVEGRFLLHYNSEDMV